MGASFDGTCDAVECATELGSRDLEAIADTDALVEADASSSGATDEASRVADEAAEDVGADVADTDAWSDDAPAETSDAKEVEDTEGVIIEDTEGVIEDAEGTVEDTEGAVEDTEGVIEDAGDGEDAEGASEDAEGVIEDVAAPLEAAQAIVYTSSLQVQRPLGTTDAKQGYYEYLPPSYSTSTWRKSPLLVFLHGLGENGTGSATDLPKVLKNGPPLLIKNNKWKTERTFIVLSPQHPGGGCPSADEVNAFLDYAIEAYNVNPDQVYLTGLSCGAYGVWNYLGKYEDKHVAAAVPIAGNGVGAWNSAGCDLGTVPLWAFHGESDGTVAPSGSTTPISNLQGCWPKPEALLTTYPGVGHDSWSRTYDGSAGYDIYNWLLKHKHE